MKVRDSVASYKISKKRYTYQDYLEMPDDGNRYEIINGELIMPPAPNTIHQKVALKIEYELLKFNDKETKGELFHAPYDVVMSDMNVVQPDILFVSTARHDIVGQEYIEGAPDLVVEVLSPSNWLYDRSEKFRAYRDAGVGEYWIVDPRADTLEVFVHEAEASDYVLLNKFKMGDVVTLHVLSGFEVAVDEVLGN